MKKVRFLSVAICLLWASPCIAGDTMRRPDDNLFLSMVLQRPAASLCAIVPAKTSWGHISPSMYPDGGKQLEKIMVENFRHLGCDVPPKLVALLFKRNRKPARLTLKSCPEKGYIVDSTGKYSRIFKKEGPAGWDKWHKKYPWAMGIIDVSLPAYDPESHILLIYIGTHVDGMAGRGRIVAYWYGNGRLTEYCEFTTWRS